MEGDGYTTPLGSPRGQGGDPTDAPGAYDSPVNTVPLRNDNAVPPGAPRVDRTVARPHVFQLTDMYQRFLNSEAEATLTILREFILRASAQALDAFHFHQFSRVATHEWTTLADMVIQGLDVIPDDREQTVTFWLHHCSPDVRDAFRARHPHFNPRPLPFLIHIRDAQGNLNVLPPRDDTRRILSFPGGAGWRPSAAQMDPEIQKDQKARTLEKRKSHEDGKR